MDEDSAYESDLDERAIAALDRIADALERLLKISEMSP